MWRIIALSLGGTATGILLNAALRHDQILALVGIGFAITAHLSLQLQK